MGDGSPMCAVCMERLGKFGGPTTLPCGHNGCLQCMAHVQRSKPECPLCRTEFPASMQLVVNHELRDLIKLTSTLHTIDGADGWQTLAAVKLKVGSADKAGYGDGDVALVPTAPPLHVDLETVLEGEGDLLSLEPPTWLPDSHAGECGICSEPFRALTRLRHHCRLCGNIFCGACCGQRLLLPPKFREPEPARVCTTCAHLLEPLQPFLAGTISKAVQAAVQDVTDATCVHSWFNSPCTADLGADIYKATNIVRAFRACGKRAPESGIPAAVLHGAAGFAILSIAKVGLGYSVGIGTGLVVARREEDDSWSAPSAIAALSCGWGLQVGGELTDLLIVLRTRAAVAAFCSTLQAGVGGGASIAVGPLGRSADAVLRLGRAGAAVCYSYSLSRGAFIGASVEGTMVSVREAVNLHFYGRHVSAKQLLLGDTVPAPAAAATLYAALDALMDWASALPRAGFMTSRDIAARDARATGMAVVEGTAAAVQRRGRDVVRRAYTAVSGRRDRNRAPIFRASTAPAGSPPLEIPGRGGPSFFGEDGEGSPEGITSPSPPPTRPRSFPVTPAFYYEPHAAPALAQALNMDSSFGTAGGHVAPTAPPAAAAEEEYEFSTESGSRMFALFAE